MYHQATRACLAGFLVLASATACDVEPARVSLAPSVAAATTDHARDRDAMAGVVMASTHVDASALARHEATDEASPVVPDAAADFPINMCRPGYTQRGQRLCISALRAGANYANASSICRNEYAAVCTYEDLTYVYLNTGADASYNPSGRFIGPLADDDRVYCGNRNITFDSDPDIWNFEGTCSKADTRRYWCCHDRE
jgi:hypothetical protein